jgi:prepilin-type N-terminal cleavage/methylation domain-containing protein
MRKKMQQNSKQKGFTLLEVLLVVGIITILAAIVIVAINPSKQLGDSRNAQRRSDVNTILNAVYQYSIDTNGTLPGEGNPNSNTKIPTSSAKEICKDAVVEGTCTLFNTNAGLVFLGDLTTSGKYIVKIPTDPGGSTNDSSKYSIFKDGNNRITVAATVTDNSATISATK